MNTQAVAHMVSTMLYGKRFFPYFAWVTIGGMNENGNGCVFSFDPVGTIEKHLWQCSGSSSKLIQPFLDSQMGHKHELLPPGELTAQRATLLVKDGFTSATERDIYTGDFLEIYTITRDGRTRELIELKRD
nr:Proteasome subunit beta type-1 [Polyrhizophydium stewartii]